MPKLSIIVTAYNIAPFIDDCLADITGQSHRNLEIIVVDDGSIDATPDRIRSWAAKDARILPILLKENSVGGVATAANAGLDRATGAYIGFADGDDRYDPTMFERLLQAAEAQQADLAVCSYVSWDGETGETALPPDESRWREIAPEGALTLDADSRRRVLALNAVPWRKLYAAPLLQGPPIRFPVGDFFYEDNPFHWFTVLSARRVAFVDARLCRHRVNRIGQTTAHVDRKLLRMFAHHGIIKRWLDDTGQDPSYRHDLLVWAARQVSWIGRKCPPELRPELFAAVQDVVALHPAAELESADRGDAIGKRTAGLLRAAAAGDFDAFCAGLDQAASRAPKRREAEVRKVRLQSLLGRLFGR